MKKAFGALIVVAGLMVVAGAGCAREDRWTLDGSRPQPLDDRKGSERAAAPAAKAEKVTAAPSTPSVIKNVTLVQENGACAVSNKNPVAVEATVEVLPGAKNTPAELPRPRMVLVPANSQVYVGRMGDGTNEWNYRLLDVMEK